MSWFWYAIVSVLFGTGYIIGSKLLLRQDGQDPTTYLIVNRLMGGLIFGLFTLVTWSQLTFDWSTSVVLIFFLSMVIFTTANLLFFTSMKMIDLSEITLIGGIQPFLALLIGVVLFSETWSWFKLIAIAMAFVGVGNIFWQRRHIKLGKGELYALLSTVLYSCGMFTDKYIVSHISVIPAISIGMLSVSLCSIVVTRKPLRAVARVFKTNSILGIIVVVVFMAFGTYFYLEAYRAGGEASAVGITLYLATILSTLYGMVVLRERDRIKQKLLATILVFVSLILMYR
jgi:drug/metabolite transporter (DMT)-like permease